MARRGGGSQGGWRSGGSRCLVQEVGGDPDHLVIVIVIALVIVIAIAIVIVIVIVIAIVIVIVIGRRPGPPCSLRGRRWRGRNCRTVYRRLANSCPLP